MKIFNFFLGIILFGFVTNPQLGAQDIKLAQEAEKAMLRSTQFMVEKISTNGGYVWNYLPDFSRRWGEMEAYKTMIWLQSPGTVSMGHLFLDAYEATGDETDTSPYRDESDQLYITTSSYIRNMSVLMNYIKSVKTTAVPPKKNKNYKLILSS